MQLPEVGVVVEHAEQAVGLGAIDLGHGGETADVVTEPAGDEQQHVDGEDRGSVVDGAGLGVAMETEHRGDVPPAAGEQIVADHDDRDPGGAEILLRVGVDQ